MEGFFDGGREITRVHHKVVMFGDRQGSAGDVGLLEGIAADRPTVNLPGDRNDRGGVHHRRGQPRNEVGRAGTGCRHADANLTGGACVTVGSQTGAFFVAYEYVAQLRITSER